MIALEAIGTILDTLALGYVAARRPWLLYLARMLGLLTENLPQEETAEALEATGAAFWRIITWDRVTNCSRTRGTPSPAPSRRTTTLAASRRTSPRSGSPWRSRPCSFDKLFHRHIDPRSFVVLHGWEGDPGSLTPDADRISERFVTLLGRVSGETLDEDGEVTAEGELELTLTLAFVPREHGGPGLWLSLGAGGEGDVPLGGGWHFVVDGELGDGLDAFVPGTTAPDGAGFVQIGADIGGEVEVRIERRDEAAVPGGPAEPWRLGEVLEVKAAELAVRIGDREPMLAAVLRIRDAAIVVSRPEKGFFRRLVPEGGVRVDFDLGLIADSSPRFGLEGGSGLEVTVPVHTSTPRLQGLHAFLALRTRPEDQEEGPALTFEASAGFGTRLGAFSAAVDRFGVILPEAPHGPPGAEWVKLPSAIGIGIDGKALKGGGFILFEPDRGRYAGVLTLTLGRWTLTAFGLLTDLDEGYSLLIVASLSFRPPFKGPFGIELAGVGVITGHNHGADVAALQASVRTGAVRTILFPQDPVAAAPRVLTTLGDVFPVREGSSLLGLGLELRWSGGLVSLVAAVVVESGLTPRTVLLASLEAVAPTRELPVVRLRVDAIGIIDSERPSVEIDGSMVESFIGPFAVTGDGTFRFRGGDDGLFLMAVGGFHPSYTPPDDAGLPPQRRLTLSLPSDNPRLRLELYLALTSNSIQLGARLEVSARKAGFSAEARLGFDALVDRDPFHLTVDIEGKAAIRYEGTTLASVGLDLTVDGPSPWRANGKATLSLLFFSITVPIHYDPGGDEAEEELPSSDAAALLAAALADPVNWETTEPAGAAALVALRTAVAEDDLAAHPAGRLGVRQSVLPLGVEVTHLGRARVAPDRFDVESVSVNGVTADQVTALRAPFAAGEFVDLSSDERLSRPAFESFVAGFSAGGEGVTAGPETAVNLSYEEIVIGPDGPLDDAPTRGRALVAAVAHGALLGPAAASPLRRHDTAARLRAAPLVTLSPESRVVVDRATLRPVPVPGAPAAATETELRQALAGMAAGPASLLVAQPHEAVGGA